MSFVRRLIICLAAVSLYAVQAVQAQDNPATPPPAGTECTNCGSLGVWGVPETVSQAPNAGPFTAKFVIINTYEQGFLITPVCQASAGLTCGTVTPSQLSLGADSRDTVYVQYTTGTGGTRTLTLHAYHDDEIISNPATGTQTVEVTGPIAPTAVTLRNRPDQLERGLCLTAGAGDAAWQCGDLLVAHGMPGYRTLGRGRALTLVYSSATAAPRPTVAVAVTQPSSGTAPTSVYTELRVGYHGSAQSVWASATYQGWNGASGPATRQIVLSVDAVSQGTAIYDYTFEVRNQYASGSASSSVTGQLIIVNRSTSRYGQGWELAGVESIQYFAGGASWPNGKMLWVGGDGSARIYTPVGGGLTKRVAPMGAFRDTISAEAGVYKRRLRHGVEVHYQNTDGRHLRTINRVGQQTSFFWNSMTADKLDSIVVPPTSTGGKYIINYSGSNVSSLVDPGGRALGLTMTSGKLTGVLDPDTVTTTFGYDGSGRMNSRTNRKGYATTYQYTNNLRVTQASVPYGPDGAVLQAVTAYTPWDERGLCVGTCGGTLTAVDTATVRTKIDGPRTDVPDTAAFYVDRWGAPTKTVNAIGVKTVIKRQSAVYPQLVTEVVYPNNRIVRMTYDTTVGRGNLKMVRDSTWHLPVTVRLPTKATVYTYGSAVAPDSPTQVADALGRTTTYTYNGMGILNAATDPRGHITQFAYDSTPGSPTRGVIRIVTEKSVETWEEAAGTADDTLTTDVVRDHVTRYGYDAKGNIDSVAAPHGLVTTYLNDPYGRAYRTWDALGTATKLEFDPLNRAIKQRQYTNAQPDSAFGLTLAGMACDATQVACSDTTTRAFTPSLPSELLTEYRQSPVGLDTLIGPMGGKRKYVYDARAALRKEVDGKNAFDETITNAAGLVTQSNARRGDQVVNTYDALGRLTQTSYAQWTDLNGVTIPGDVITFTHDTLNNLLTAANRHGAVTRTYFADGSLKSKIFFRPNQFNGLGDTLRYHYNAAGQRTVMVHGPDSIFYTYNASSGDLTTMQAKWGAGAGFTSTVSFTWDALGRRREVTLPRGVQVSYRYDKLGTLRRLKSTHAWTRANGSNLKVKYAADQLDPLGRLLHQRTVCDVPGESASFSACDGDTGGVLEKTLRYNRLGMLVSTNLSTDFDSLGYDAGGNILQRRPAQIQQRHYYTMEDTTNRLVRDSMFQFGQSWVTSYLYDPNGARIREVMQGIAIKEYFYDGLGRTNGLGFVVQPGTQYVAQVDMCHYDGEGQMIKPCDNLAPLLGYDGANVTGAFGNGTWWTFVHGPGTDDPLLGLWRDGFNAPKLLLWVTDGNGRQFAVADSSGEDPGHAGMDDGGAIGYWGWQWVGGTRRSHGFAASRTGPKDAPTLSVFRNRLYDQSTGRWTQEDPIGVAGGINLYQFNGNNPASYTDPFGLCPQWLTGKPCSGGVDLAASFVPGLSTGIDAATVVTGENPLTGEKVGVGGWTIALAGLATPASGGQIRGLLRGAKHALSEGLLRVTSAFSDRALRKTYHGAIEQINRHKEILANASPEQVNSITKDIVKHEKRLQAVVEEMQRRGLEP